MNTAILTELMNDVEDRFVALGVPRAEAVRILRYTRNSALAAELEARNDAQFLIDFDRMGSDRLGEQFGMSGQAMRKRRTKILSRKQPEVAVMVARRPVAWHVGPSEPRDATQDTRDAAGRDSAALLQG